MCVEFRGDPGDFGPEGSALAEKAGDDMIALAREIADVAVVEVDADGIAVVWIEGLGEELERVAGFENRECCEVGIMRRTTKRRGLQTETTCRDGQRGVRGACGGWLSNDHWLSCFGFPK